MRESSHAADCSARCGGFDAYFAYTLARKFHERGEYTISGAIAKSYGRGAQLVTSIIMIYALSVVNVSMYSGGAAVLSALLHIPTALAAIMTGVVTILYVSSGGLFAVAYTNLVHAIFKYVGLVLAFAAGLAACGGYSNLVSHVKPSMLQWTTVGWPTIFAWTIANVGAVFSTQYIIQGICSLSDNAQAKKASVFSGLLIIPVGIMASLIGLAASILFPNKPSSQAFPLMVTLMDPISGGLVVGGLIAAVFGTVAAGTIGSAALLMKDFYIPLLKERPSDKKILFMSRLLTVFMGLLPIPFAIFAPQILNTIFFARALRTTIAVVVLIMFYLPNFSSGTGATWGMIFSVIMTTIWYLLKDPFGVDNIYVALLCPLVVMIIDHVRLLRKQKQYVTSPRSEEW